MKELVKDLENVQKLATKICLKRWHMSYEEMLHAMQIPTLYTVSKVLYETCLSI